MHNYIMAIRNFGAPRSFVGEEESGFFSCSLFPHALWSSKHLSSAFPLPQKPDRLNFMTLTRICLARTRYPGANMRNSG